MLATHLGMTVSPWVLLAVADRLVADRSRWRSFDPSLYLPRVINRMMPLIYPSAEGASGSPVHEDSVLRDRGSRVVDRLLHEHRDLEGLVRVLEKTGGERGPLRRADYYLLRDIVGYVLDYAERVHHPVEDLLIRKLLRKPGSRRLAGRLQREHESASIETQKLLDRLDELIRRPSQDRARVVRQGCVAFAKHQRAHMGFEDEQIFPRAIASLTTADWRTIEARLFAAEDPLFGSKIGSRHRVLYEYLLARASASHATVGRPAGVAKSRRRRNAPAVLAGA